ncbi:tyrosine-protein phosphatase non-receptor type 21-like [Petromyzon marinus]|uniref:tyrosine-protein phosphatase non-receptor type 21-like n=1 Tax=Petromyzon marinus TaxID=7757 RepID=UPI003F7162AB
MSRQTNRELLSNGPESNVTPKQQPNGPTAPHHGILKTKPRRDHAQGVDGRPLETTADCKGKGIERQGDLHPSDRSSEQVSGSNRFSQEPDTSKHSLERRGTYNISSEDAAHSNRSPGRKDRSQGSSEDLGTSDHSAGARTSRRASGNRITSAPSSGRTHPSQHSSEEHPRSSTISSGGLGPSADDPAGHGHQPAERLEEVRPQGGTVLRRGSADGPPSTAQGSSILIPYVNVPYNTRLQQALARACVHARAAPSRIRSMRGSRSLDLLEGAAAAPAEGDGDRAPRVPEFDPGARSSVRLRKWANPGRERPTSEILLPSKNIRFEKLDGVTRPKKYNTSTGDFTKPNVTSLPRMNLPGVPNFTTVSRRHTGDSPIADRGSQLAERVRRGDAAQEFGHIPWGPGERASVVDSERIRQPASSTPASAPQSPRGNVTRRATSSHVRVRVNGEMWHYIATQWPQPHTESDFWHMVWEHGVNVIAALTPVQVAGEAKPQRYWPRLGSRQRPCVYGDLAVHATFRGTTAAGGCATTGLRVTHAPSGRERNLWHLHHPEWSRGSDGDGDADDGDDDNNGAERFLEFLQELQSVRRLTGSMLPPRTPLPPTLVHCAGGDDGPTGVLILSELMVACLEQNVNADVPQVLGALRQQRPHLVPTLEHYKFVYRVLARYLGRSRLI